MCGFAGILSARDDLDLKQPLLKMLAALHHRGPDGSAAGEVRLASGWRVGLAHARLAILDTSDAGLQPMATPDRNLWTIFNGEIYNHRELRRELQFQGWRSGTDTETILHAWNERGESAIDALRGMFGLCLLDVHRQRFWVVRDRLGIKPVYFSRVDDGLILVASELRSILASGLIERRLDQQALPGYFAMGAVAPPWTLVSGVERLHPAEIRSVDLSSGSSKVSSRRYWFPPFAANAPINENVLRERTAELKTAFNEAASNHLLSDVPVGVFLSGGIDSGAIVEAVTRSHPHVETFSVAFTEQKFDESGIAAQTAARFGTRHQSLVLSPREMLKLMPSAFAAYDTPSCDGINTWLISKVVREAGVKVALSGLGGDELFAGYPYHRLMRKLANPAFRVAARGLASGLSLFGRASIRSQKLGMAAACDDRVEQYLALRRVVSPELAARLINRRGADLPPEERAECSQAATGLDPVNAFSVLDLRCYMQNTLLHDSDQMSMAHALESRVPFLDHVVVEAAARIPGDVKLRRRPGHRHKSLLLDLLDRPLPTEATSAPKRGFMFPWNQWLRSELKDFVTAGLENPGAIAAAGLDEQAVIQVNRMFQQGNSSVRATDILCLLSLLNWVDRVILSRDVVEIEPLPSAAYVRNLLGAQDLRFLVV